MLQRSQHPHFYILQHINKSRPRLTTDGFVLYNMTGRILSDLYPKLSDNIGIVVFSFIVLSGNELHVVCIDYSFLESSSEIRVNGMHDIAIGSVGILSRGHYDKVSVSCVDHLYIVYCKTIVKGYGHYRLHRAFIEKFSDFDVCDLHVFFLSSFV